MTRTDFLLIAAGALFTAFVLGWLAGWLTHRATGPAPVRAAPPPTDDTGDQLAAAAAETRAARDQLREAHVEIEELRAYIDRKLANRPPAAD